MWFLRRQGDQAELTPFGIVTKLDERCRDGSLLGLSGATCKKWISSFVSGEGL